MDKVYRNIEDAEAGIIIDNDSIVGTSNGEILKMKIMNNMVQVGDNYYLFGEEDENVFCIMTCNMIGAFRFKIGDDGIIREVE